MVGQGFGFICFSRGSKSINILVQLLGIGFFVLISINDGRNVIIEALISVLSFFRLGIGLELGVDLRVLFGGLGVSGSTPRMTR